MRRIILTGYNVGVFPIPPDDGGGRVVQIAAQDASEVYEIALDDQTWESIVQMGRRVKLLTPEDAA